MGQPWEEKPLVCTPPASPRACTGR